MMDWKNISILILIVLGVAITALLSVNIALTEARYHQLSAKIAQLQSNNLKKVDANWRKKLYELLQAEIVKTDRWTKQTLHQSDAETTRAMDKANAIAQTAIEQPGQYDKEFRAIEAKLNSELNSLQKQINKLAEESEESGK